MHTFDHGQIRISYNPDLSGEVRISAQTNAAGDAFRAAQPRTGFDVCIPGEAMKAFIAEIVRSSQIHAIEQMDQEQMFHRLGLITNIGTPR